MCGNVGVLGNPHLGAVGGHRGADRMTLRKQNSSCAREIEHATFDHTLLSIIAEEPTCNSLTTLKQRSILTFDGQVYDVVEICASDGRIAETTTGHFDTEVLFDGLGRHGIGFLENLNGVVAASQWDADDQVCSAALRRSRVVLLGYTLLPTIVATQRDTLGSEGTRRGRLLAAPTWSRGGSDGFENLMDSKVTLALAGWALDKDWDFVVRLLLSAATVEQRTRAVQYMDMTSFPDACALLIEKDVLVTDWSSIATGCRGLRRPVVFWDRHCPFLNVRLSADDRVHGGGLDGDAGRRVAEFVFSVVVG